MSLRTKGGQRSKIDASRYMGDPEHPLAALAIDRKTSISEKRQRDEILRPTLPRFFLLQTFQFPEWLSQSVMVCPQV